VKLSTRLMGDVTVVDAAGRLTRGDGATSFRETIHQLALSGQKKLLLNLAEVSYIDSSGIAEMVSGITTLSHQGGMMKLLNLPERGRNLLKITSLDKMFEVHDDEAKAVASFQ
jgi:anti-sigma B factor antagonist